MTREGLALLRAAVAQNRGYAPAWEHLAREAAKAGRQAEARRAVAGMLKACPPTPGLRRRAEALLAELDQEEGLLEVRAGRYARAIAALERMLGREPSLRLVRAFWNPWQPALPPAKAAAHRRTVETLASRGDSPWALYFRGCLSPGGKRAAEDYDAAAAGGPRYEWMNLKAGWERLMRGDARGAVPRLTRALRARPSDWKAHGYLAEARLCLGDPKGARRECVRAFASAGEEKAQALAWQGALELWLGDYERALSLLEEARALGAQHAYCWSAAALVMLGRLPQALALLDETIARFPRDTEALLWRGEAKRLAGRPREALGDLSRARGWFWAGANAALAHAELGDEAGLAAALAELPAPIMERLARELGTREKRKLLKGAFSRAKGFRRDDYAQAFWLPL